MKDKRITKLLVGAVSLFLIFAVIPVMAYADYAGPIDTINYQGYLATSSSSPVTGTRDIMFKIYRDPGGEIWSGTYRLSVSNGIFSVILGQGSDTLASAILSYQSYDLYLGVTVCQDDSNPCTSWDPEMSPRQLLTAVPYAIRARDSDESYYLQSHTPSDFATSDHSHSFPETTGSATDSQIPDDITINYAAAAGNADTVDGLHATAFSTSGHSHDHGTLSGLGDDDHPQYFNLSQSETVTGRPHFSNGTTPDPPFTTSNSGVVYNFNADKLDGWDAGFFGQRDNSLQTSLNADMLDGLHASSFLTTSSDYGRSGVSSTLYEGTTSLTNKYVNQTGDTITGNYYLNGGQLYIRNSSSSSRVLVGRSTYDYGNIYVYGSDGSYNVGMGAYSSATGDTGALSLFDTSNINRVTLYVNGTTGYISADVKNFRAPNPNQPGTEIVYAAIEGPEAAAYIRDTASLISGRATIDLPDHFKAISVEEGMTVQLTPLSAESLGLAVVQKSLEEGIVVQELGGGEGDYDFDFHIMAIRKGHEDYQVIQHELNFNAPE